MSTSAKPIQWNIDKALVAPEWQWPLESMLALPLFRTGVTTGTPLVNLGRTKLNTTIQVNDASPGPSWVTTPGGDALRLPNDDEGLGDEINLGTPISVAAGSDFTLSWVVTPDFSATLANPGVFRAGLNGTDPTFVICNGADNSIWVRLNSVDILNPAVAHFTEGERGVFTVVVRSGTDVEFWKDGALVASATHSTTTAAFTIYQFGWQSSADHADQFGGDWETLLFDDRAWTNDQVRQWHSDPFGAFRHHRDMNALSLQSRDKFSTTKEIYRVPAKPQPWSGGVEGTDIPEVLFAWENWKGAPRDHISNKLATLNTNFGTNVYVDEYFGNVLDLSSTPAWGNGFEWANISDAAWQQRPVTIEALVYVEPNIPTDGTSCYIFLAGGQNNAGSVYLQVRYSSQSYLLGVIRRTSSGWQQHTDVNINSYINNWIHVVATVPPLGQNPQIYINGRKISQGTFGSGSGLVNAATDALQISDDVGNQFPGKLSHVRVFAGILGASAIKDLAADPFTPVTYNRAQRIYPPRDKFKSLEASAKTPPREEFWNYSQDRAAPEWSWFWESVDWATTLEEGVAQTVGGALVTNVNGVTWEYSEIGRVPRFTADNQHLSLGYFFDYDPNKHWSAWVWINVDIIDGATHSFLAQHDSPADGRVMAVQVGATGGLQFAGGSSAGTEKGGGTIVPNKWYLAAIISPYGALGTHTLKLLDTTGKVLIDAVAGGNAPSGFNAPVTLGGHPRNFGGFKGRIGAAGTHNTILDNQQLAQLARDPYGPFRYESPAYPPRDKFTSLGEGVGEQEWNASGAYVEDKWHWFWEDAYLAVPMLGGADTPMEYVSGKRFQNTNVDRIQSEHGLAMGMSGGAIGDELIIPDWSTNLRLPRESSTIMALVNLNSDQFNYWLIMGDPGNIQSIQMFTGPQFAGRDLTCFLRTATGNLQTPAVGTSQVYPLGQWQWIVQRYTTGGNLRGSAWNLQGEKLFEVVSGTTGGDVALHTGYSALHLLGSSGTSPFIGVNGLAGAYYGLRADLTDEQIRQIIKDPKGAFEYHRNQRISPYQVKYTSQEDNTTTTSKPQPWNIDPAHVIPEAQGLWDGLEIVVPYWERGGTDIEAYVPSMGGTVRMGANNPSGIVWNTYPSGPGVRYSGGINVSFLENIDPGIFDWPNKDITILGYSSWDNVDAGLWIGLGDDLGAGANRVVVRLQTGVGFSIGRIDNVSSVRYTPSTSLPLGKFTLYGGVINPENFAYSYLNGVRTATNSEVRTMDSTTSLTLSLGSGYYGGATDGNDTTQDVTGIYIWSRALTEQEQLMLLADPFLPIRYHRKQRTYPPRNKYESTEFSRKYNARPQQWSTDTGYVDRDLEWAKPVFAWEVSEHGIDSLPLDRVTGQRADNPGEKWSLTSYESSEMGMTWWTNPPTVYGTGFLWTNLASPTWLGKSMTIEGLIYLHKDADQETNRIIRIGGNNFGAVSMELRWDAANNWFELYTARLTSSAYPQSRTNEAFPVGQWVHVAAVVPSDYTAPTLYINGVKPSQTTITGSGTVGAESGEIMISDRGSSLEFMGGMSYLRVYPSLLSHDQIAKLHTDPFAPTRYARSQRVYPPRDLTKSLEDIPKLPAKSTPWNLEIPNTPKETTSLWSNLRRVYPTWSNTFVDAVENTPAVATNVKMVQTELGTSMVCTASNGRVNCGTTPVSGNTDRTIVQIVRRTGAAGDQSLHSIDPGNYGTNGARWTLRTTTVDGRLRLEIQNWGYDSSSYLPLNEWVVVASVYRNGALTVYMNGETSSWVALQVNTDPTYDLKIGNAAFNSWGCTNIEIAATYVWDTALPIKVLHSFRSDPFLLTRHYRDKEVLPISSSVTDPTKYISQESVPPVISKPQNWNITKENTEPEWSSLWEGLRACIPMLDSSGPVDIISGRRLTVATGIPTMVNGAYGPEGDLTGDAWELDPFDGPTNFPVSMVSLVRHDNVSANNEAWLDLANSASGTQNINLMHGSSPSNRAPGFVMRNGGYLPAFSPTEIPQGQWYTLGSVWKSQTEADLYVNGVKVVSNNFNAAWFTPNRLSVGRFGDSTPSNAIQNGAVSISYVWDRELTAEEFTRLTVDPFGPLRYNRDQRRYRVLLQNIIGFALTRLPGYTTTPGQKGALGQSEAIGGPVTIEEGLKGAQGTAEAQEGSTATTDGLKAGIGFALLEGMGNWEALGLKGGISYGYATQGNYLMGFGAKQGTGYGQGEDTPFSYGTGAKAVSEDSYLHDHPYALALGSSGYAIIGRIYGHGHGYSLTNTTKNSDAYARLEAHGYLQNLGLKNTTAYALLDNPQYEITTGSKSATGQTILDTLEDSQVVGIKAVTYPSTYLGDTGLTTILPSKGGLSNVSLVDHLYAMTPGIKGALGNTTTEGIPVHVAIGLKGGDSVVSVHAASTLEGLGLKSIDADTIIVGHGRLLGSQIITLEEETIEVLAYIARTISDTVYVVTQEDLTGYVERQSDNTVYIVRTHDINHDINIVRTHDINIEA